MSQLLKEGLMPSVSPVPDDEFTAPLTGLVGADLTMKNTAGREAVASVVFGARQAVELFDEPKKIDEKPVRLRPGIDGEAANKSLFVSNAFGGYEVIGPEERDQRLDSLQRWAEGGNELEDQESVKMLAAEAARRFMGYPTKNWAEIMIDG